ncbi:efflux RND transporter permease subunit [Dyella sp.]|uniref:efflux RND transporter permease subunit n=1 Tax=Dyella sp. TaxID=1869338 RepID=UPI002ED11894
MTWTDRLVRHGRTFALMVLVLAVAGLVAGWDMPMGLFPQVSFPRVVVDLDAGDRPADQTALLLTRPVEEAIRTVPGVAGVRSETTRGSAQVSVDFGWGRDMLAATLMVDAAIAKVLPQLPTGSSYGVRRMDPTVFPIISYALRSDTMSPEALRDLAQYRIVPLLASVPGLARVDVQGGETAEIEVEANPHRLALYGLSMSDLASSVAKANALQAVGRLQDDHKLYLVVVNQGWRDASALHDVVLRSQSGREVKLGDVADIHPGHVPQWIKVAEDGKPAVLFNVYEQPDGNAVQIAAQVRTRLAQWNMPPGVTLVNWYDQSELVLQSAHGVRDAIAIGLLLAAVVLLVFLRSVRIVAIAMLVVPATLAITVLLLRGLGMSFNIMTLGGMAAAVGLVVDDAIVMIEHIARRAGAHEGAKAVWQAAAEFVQPLSGSSLATLIVFVPLGLLQGVTGAFSRALSITMACALTVSWLLTVSIVPLLAGRLIDFTRWRDPGHSRHRLDRIHTWLYLRLARRPVWLGVMLAGVVAVGIMAGLHVGTGFMPAVDESGFVMDYFTAPGTSIDESVRQVGQVEDILRATPEVATFSRRLGTGLGGDLGQAHHGDFFVRLKPGHARSTDEVMGDVRERIEKGVPGVEIELAQLMEDLIGDLTAVPQPIEIKLYAVDPSVLPAQADKVASALAGIAGVVDVRSGLQLAGDAIDIHVDPDRAAFEGMGVDEVTSQLDQAMNGTIATQWLAANKSVGVRVRMPGIDRAHITDLLALPLRASDGHVFPLRRIASLETVSGQPQISRENLQPMLAVTARIEGRGIGAAVADVQRRLARAGVMEPGVRYELGGLYQQQQIAFGGLVRVFVMALMAEFVLLMFLYRRIVLAAWVMGSSLLSVMAVFVALWLSGVDLNVTAMMGMTMIIGMGTEMAIFYVSEYVSLAARMAPARALRRASRDRLRPITMTTLAAVLALVPLALALGPGAGIEQPLAIAIVAGLLLQYPMVLLVLPILIGFTDRRHPTLVG